AKSTSVETPKISAKIAAKRKVVERRVSIRFVHDKAETADAPENRRFARRIDLATKFADMDIHDIRLRQKPIMPDLMQQHVAGNDLLGPPHKIFQQLEFARK